MPEWLNGAVSKTVVRENVPWVQIPPPPPTIDDCVLLVYKIAPLEKRGLYPWKRFNFLTQKSKSSIFLIWIDRKILNEMIQI